jgi:hypothetical protein
MILFGSSLHSPQTARDIDLGVDGVRARDFFCLYRDLYSRLPKPVDLIDLSERSLFADMIRSEGAVIYER